MQVVVALALCLLVHVEGSLISFLKELLQVVGVEELCSFDFRFHWRQRLKRPKLEQLAVALYNPQ